MKHVALAIVVVASGAGCKTTLGPMPGATGVSSVPAGRTDAELQLGVMPGYYLSQSTVAEPAGAAISQLSLAVDPGAHVPGLVAGFRIFGPSHDTLGEPMLGYRRALGDGTYSISGIAFATHGQAEEQQASYQATRAGLEGGVDVRLSDPRKNIEPHVIASLSLSAVSADGTYCQDDDLVHGVDCPDEPDPPTNVTDAHVGGAYALAAAGLALDFARHLDGNFHGARLMALAAIGTMPRVVGGEQDGMEPYFSIGLALSISAGGR
jgi:hypothetical protein